MKIEDDFRDLAPLSPRLDPERWARLTAAVEAAAAPELARRSRLADPGLLLLLSDWTRPALSAAVAMASAAVLFLVLAGPGPEAEVAPGVAEGIGYPGAVADWVETGWTPSVEELLVSMDGGAR